VRNGCHWNLPRPLASAAPSFPAAAEAAAALVVVGHTTGARVVRIPLPHQQKGTGFATSTATVAAASTSTAASAAATLSSVDEYLSVAEFPGLDSGGRNNTSDNNGSCVVVQRGNPSLMPLLGHVCCWMLNKLTKRSLEEIFQLSLSAMMGDD
jgi:hypothetical protein